MHEHSRNQPSPVATSYSHHTAAATPTHTLMRTPHHPPTHSVAAFNHVCTRAACRGALVGATSAIATWVDVHVWFGLVSDRL